MKTSNQFDTNSTCQKLQLCLVCTGATGLASMLHDHMCQLIVLGVEKYCVGVEACMVTITNLCN